MSRYWVNGIYNSTKTKIFDKAWQYDLKNGTIAVDWKELGDISQIKSKDELHRKFKEVYGNIKNFTKDCNCIWNFYNEISLGDVIIARRGTKKIVGIGTVTGTAFYDEEKGKERVAYLTDDIYPNFIKVKWDEKEIKFDKIIFSFYTIYEISEEKFQFLTKGMVPEETEEDVEQPTEFALEKYLEDFIVTNFDGIFKGQLELYRDPEGNIGQQYPIIGNDGKEIGRIDILSKEPSTNSYVVIELKKGRGSDKVVGQILRYMSWVKENLCQDGEDIKGLIICKELDERLSYALKLVRNIIKVKLYSVNFKLSD